MGAALAVEAPEAAPSHHVWSHVFNILVFGGGAIALGVMMRRLGWARARDVLEGVGGWFALILALDVVGMGLDAGAPKPAGGMLSFVTSCSMTVALLECVAGVVP